MEQPQVAAAVSDRATASSAMVLAAPSGVASSPQAGFTAEVTARDALGRLFLQAAGMTFRVDEALDLPIGARLQLVLPAAAGSPAHAGMTSGDAKPDVIERALVELFHIRTSADRTLDAPQARPLPPDSSLAARLLRLIGALPTASPAADATPETENATPTMTNRGLGNASPELGRPGSEASLGGWRMLAQPFGLEDPLGLRLYVREDPGDGERSNQGQHDEPSPQRAIFELDFSHVGRCQVDVLCQGKRFDLILRTKAALDPDVQTEIRALFLAARDAAGWGGEISFRTDDLVSLPTPTTPIRPVTA